MVLGRDRKEWKAEYFQKVERILSQYDKVLVCDADNVTSKQFQQIRTGLRGQGEILMGKNTMMKKAMRQLYEDKPELEKLSYLVKLNVGLVCFNGDMKEIRDLVMSFKVPAAARTGAVAPVPVVVPPQVTTLGPEKTSFFQALSVPTKITRGNIEITAPVNLINEGDKVGESAATLLNMLKISPFTYGLDVISCYDAGTIYSPDILDITEDDIKAKFLSAVSNVAAVSLSIGYPTAASAPHSIANAFKNIQAIAAATEITFPQVEKLKEYLANPEAFASAAPEAAEAAEEAAPAAEESEESSDEDFGMDLFG
ncbi:Oidioi.mRNA.OKI2018_I69.chr1.g511.t1.cds [Oikopleura dioica]|uniref:60S acidic ribosomal protein P0 n=1 Tax=Oikopleura dioica TaxID=34765 RepID=A0ABN7SPB7_OIKDI|nr:Oidioi.mRNA.OKI2018_I69.chr1.g511.t1.cds [Oikopleura dioica]